MQDECNVFFGWKKNNCLSSKLKIYKKLITSIENEMKIAEVLKEIRSICNDLVQDTSFQVSINSLPSFTMYLKKGAAFVSEYAYDSEENLSDDDNNTDEISAICHLSEEWESDSEFVNNNSVTSKLNCTRSSAVDVDLRANSLDKSMRVSCSEDPLICSNNKMTKQPVVLLSPLDISNIPEFTSFNIKKNGNTSQVMQSNIIFTKKTPEPVRIKHRKKGSEPDIYTSIKDGGQGILQQEYLESTSEIPSTDILIENHISKKPRLTFDMHSRKEFLKVIRKTADDSQIVSTLERNFICNYCGKAFLQKSTMKKHILICPVRDDGAVFVKPSKKTPHRVRYECKLCQTIFISKFTFTKHNANTHNLKRSFRCVVCGWSFFNETELQHHCSIRHGLSGSKLFKCPYCKNSFSRRYDLNYHCRMKHGGKKPYICSICMKSFKDKLLYNLHEQNHGYKCDVCTLVCKSESEMAVHRASHLEINTYKCEICSRTFMNKGPFTKHIQIHERERKC